MDLYMSYIANEIICGIVFIVEYVGLELEYVNWNDGIPPSLGS